MISVDVFGRVLWPDGHTHCGRGYLRYAAPLSGDATEGVGAY